jgi:hypothetical protein
VEEGHQELAAANRHPYGEAEGMRWLSGALKEPDRVVLRLVPEKAVA